MEALREFLTSSTIHGLAHLASAHTVAKKIFWATVVPISSSYIEWTETPVSSTTTTRPIDELKFPEVTVCPPKG